MLLDKLYWGNDIFAEGWPDSSPGHIIRSLIILTSVLAMILSLIANGILLANRPTFRLDENNKVPVEQLSILAVLSISVAFLLLFIFNPAMFNTLSLEDGIIEWGSFALLFASGMIAAISLFLSLNISAIPKSTQFSIALLSLIFFVIAMEEVSWLQRTLEIETPQIFIANIQHEMNLHNFYTNPIENIYYNGVFLFLVILPFIRFLFPCILDSHYLRIFVARPFIAVIGSVACAYNFDMWNIIFTQIAFFASLLILCTFFMFGSRNEKYIISFTIFLLTATQLIFLVKGENFARIWEVTEYKELFIPLALFIYSMDLFVYMKRARSSEKN